MVEPLRPLVVGAAKNAYVHVCLLVNADDSKAYYGAPEPARKSSTNYADTNNAVTLFVALRKSLCGLPRLKSITG